MLRGEAFVALQNTIMRDNPADNKKSRLTLSDLEKALSFIADQELLI